MAEKKRIRVYIDAANLILTAKGFDLAYDIEHLLTYLVHKYRATSCVYFTGKVSSLDSDYKLIAALGAEIVYKEIYSEHAKTKANCDVEIAHRVTRDIERKEVWCL
jgi:hypothetical protein